MTFEELYRNLLKSTVDGTRKDELAGIQTQETTQHQLDCLLRPQNFPPVYRVEDCDCEDEKNACCAAACMFDAFYWKDGSMEIDKEKCVGCNACVDECKAEKIKASRDILPAIEAIRTAKGPVYAMVAPAFHGQFSPEVTPGMLRSAFKQLGFTGMVEVAVFADILTLKEALEFDKNILSEQDYQLTSCCCPIWIAMIRKVYKDLMPHVPGAVSPMVACGRAIKHVQPDALTIFVGPCVAKKAEAREPDVADAVDFVLTFQEVQDLFDFTGIHPEEMEDSERDHSSRAGRIYAHSGGVSEAVKDTVNRLNPGRKITVRTRRADGVPACKQMLSDLLSGSADANFFEGMGCVGGCVGGPKRLIDREDGRANVEAYGSDAQYPTPIDNPYVIELLQRLGYDTIESLLEEDDIFTRNFH